MILRLCFLLSTHLPFKFNSEIRWVDAWCEIYYSGSCSLLFYLFLGSIQFNLDCYFDIILQHFNTGSKSGSFDRKLPFFRLYFVGKWYLIWKKSEIICIDKFSTNISSIIFLGIWLFSYWLKNSSVKNPLYKSRQESSIIIVRESLLRNLW